MSEIASNNQKSLNDILIGTWITTSGTADSTARIYKFYESGIMDSYIGSLKDEPLTGSYELDNDKIYISKFSILLTAFKLSIIIFTGSAFKNNSFVSFVIKPD